MNNEITRQRLLEIARMLQDITEELLEASNIPSPNPRKRRNLKAGRVAHYMNLIEKRESKKREK